MPFQVTGLISTITPLDIVDILIVAFILYKMYMGVKDSRALALFKGIIVLLGITFLSKVLELYVIYWLLQKLMTMMLLMQSKSKKNRKKKRTKLSLKW